MKTEFVVDMKTLTNTNNESNEKCASNMVLETNLKDVSVGLYSVIADALPLTDYLNCSSRGIPC